ncbi:MAG TPA: hypothetical protein VIL45_07050 [Thermoplasmata archaeon]
MVQTIMIDGEIYNVERIHSVGYGDLHHATMDDGTEWYLSADSESAGEAAKERWRDMVESDPSEFRCMVGDETLVQWALGNAAGPGSAQVSSLEEWLELTADHPEEEWGSYDGREADAHDASEELVEELGYSPGVAYRHN